MLQSIPTRIAGAAIVHQTPSPRRRLGRSRATTPLAIANGHLAASRTNHHGRFRIHLRAELRVNRSSVPCVASEVNSTPAWSTSVWGAPPTVIGRVSACAKGTRTLSVPAGVACGWQVLSQAATLELRSSCEIEARAWQWLRWNDRDLELQWPELPAQLANHAPQSQPEQYCRPPPPRLDKPQV
ncbi:MAG: hypothetical protein R3C56_12350 [Pirellulaceae bacterium]